VPINKPYRRTCRAFLDGEYSEGGRWQYMMHEKYSNDPQHYIRAFLLIQQDLKDLFAYVEPDDINLKTYSHRIHQLLMRTCVEIEANFTAILLENNYQKHGNWNMDDYKLINFSHRLSSYDARIPGWHGKKFLRTPFINWSHNKPLKWYQAYNKSKHDRQNNFKKAKFKHLIDAVCGLAIVITSQFSNNSYFPGPIGIALEYQGYDSDDKMISAIGELFRVKMPTDWPMDQRYDFDWSKIKSLSDPFQEFDHASCRGKPFF